MTTTTEQYTEYKRCGYCDKPFIVRYKNQKYCNKWHRKNARFHRWAERDEERESKKGQ